jgi:1-deoxyxylulose-5-phosphate synthase
MLKGAYDKGIFLWDSADTYGTHVGLKAGLKLVPRDKVAILTKTDAYSAPKTQEDIERFLKEIGTDYIDILLLHTRMDPNWADEDKGAMEIMAKAKEKKLIRAVGLSCHSAASIELAAKTPWVDICMVRLNPAGERMDDENIDVVKKARAAGKGIVGIKVLGEGSLVGGKEHDEALRYAVSKDALHCFSIGSEGLKEIEDNIARIEKLAVPV